MKKVEINGKFYKTNHLYGLSVSKKGAVFLKHKEKILFNKGIAIVWYNDDPIKYFGLGEKELRLFYYNPGDGEDEIIIMDSKIQAYWSRIFVLMYDEDGICLLMANRELISTVGVHCELTNTDVEAVLTNALNVAGLCGYEFLARVKNFVNSLNMETTFLEATNDER